MLLTFLSLMTRMMIGFLRVLGYSGTSLPGLWVEKYAPWLLTHYAKHYEKIIFITGTNGKTTTQLTLQKILENNQWQVVNNHSGSNMFRGIAAVVLGIGIPTQGSVLLCEVEEATMPIITKYIKPHLIVITNFFRDQLDAYGELHKTSQYILEACRNTPSSTVVANVDDPMVRSLISKLSHDKVTYSLADAHSFFRYESDDMSGQEYKADYVAKELRLMDDLSTEASIYDKAQGVVTKVSFQPPGFYNVYNLMAAYVVARIMQLDEKRTLDGISTVKPPFGRGERVVVQKDGKTIEMQLFLVKNPAGFSQVWELIRQLKNPIDLVLGLNDNVADGKDVSWIWDIRLERPANPNPIRNVYFTGRRALDMALRFKYASFDPFNQIASSNIQTCLKDLIRKNNGERRIYILATYTATNEFRKALGQYINISPFVA